MRLIRLVAASIRQMVPSPTSATQAATAPNATCPGSTPLGEPNLFWILPFRMLTRVIADGSDAWKSVGGWVIQREPAPTATNNAVLPGSLSLSSTASVDGSTCTSSLCAKLPTKSPRPPAATSPAGFASLSAPTKSARPERAPTRVRVSSLSFTTQTDPYPATTFPGERPTRMTSTTLLVRGSILTSESGTTVVG